MRSISTKLHRLWHHLQLEKNAGNLFIFILSLLIVNSIIHKIYIYRVPVMMYRIMIVHTVSQNLSVLLGMKNVGNLIIALQLNIHWFQA